MLNALLAGILLLNGVIVINQLNIYFTQQRLEENDRQIIELLKRSKREDEEEEGKV